MQSELSFEYDGKAAKIIKQIAKYAGFNLITLFIYRFWAKTHLRRYFWSSVRLDGESFTYHGTGKELFIGFVIFFCLFFCFYIADHIIRLLLADGLAHVIYSIIVAIGFLFLFHMAIFRMLKYRLSRTSWKGIRFGLDGKARYYALQALLLMLVLILSLGLAYPWVRARLINYRLNRSRFGSGYFTSNLKGRKLALAYYISKLPLLVMLGVFITFAALTHYHSNGIITKEIIKNSASHVIGQNLALAGLFVIALISLFLLNIFYRLFEAKAVVSQLHFKDIAFANNLKLIKITILFALLSFFYYIFTLLALFSVGYILGFNPWFLPLLYPVYVAYFFASLALLNWVVARVILATSLKGDTDILKDVSSYRKDEPSHGEGLFEILDIGNL